jgi:VWFA-related protein
MKTVFFRALTALILLPALLATSVSSAFAQEEAQIHITQIDKSQFPQVTVYLSVTNSKGEPVGIDTGQIQLFENGQLVQALDIRGGGPGSAEPLTTMLVMDISGSMDKNGKFDAAKSAAKDYVNQMRPGDQTGIIAFDTQIHNVQAPTSDIPTLINAIDALETGSDTAMYNALMEAEKTLEGISGRKAIIVLTDGMDNKSSSTADDVINGVGPSGTTISTVGFGDASTATQAGLDEAALKNLAEKTGGRYSYAPDAQSLSAFYQQYGRTLQSEFSITFMSNSPLLDGVNRALTATLNGVPSSEESKYNPGGVLPEVASVNWTLFGMILGGLFLLLLIPFVIGRISAGREGGSKNSKGSSPKKGKKPRIKLK